MFVERLGLRNGSPQNSKNKFNFHRPLDTRSNFVSVNQTGSVQKFSYFHLKHYDFPLTLEYLPSHLADPWLCELSR